MLLILTVLVENIFQKTGNKDIQTNIFKIHAYDSVMCRYFCVGFIDFMLKGKSLTDFTNLFSPNNFFKKLMI